MPHFVTHHASFAALCSYALGQGPGPAISPAIRHRFDHAQLEPDSPQDSGFYVLNGPLADVCATLRGGWAKGVSRMRTTLRRVEAPIVQSVRRRGVWGAQGDSIDMPRLYNGMVDHCWRGTRRAAVSSPPRIRIVVSIAASYTVSPDQMFFRGAAATALTESLVAAGYMVEVHLASAAQAMSGDGSMTHTAVVKSYDAPLNLSALCSMTAHAATLRRVVWTARLRQTGGVHMPSDQVGAPLDVTPENIGLLALPGERTLIVDKGVLNANAANAWIAQAVATLAGEVAA